MKERIASDKKFYFKKLLLSLGAIDLLFAFATIRIANINHFYFMAGLNAVVILIASATRTFTALTIDEENNEVILEFNNLLKYKSEKRFPLSDLEYTYKREAIYRGHSGRTLRIFAGGKKRLKIIKDTEGWPEYHLDNLVLLLDKYNVPRKFTGYSLKDEYPVKSTLP